MTMKKVININFQGRVVPIEETAYELLKQYIDSLRKYFANEEGKDEIINDIEGRIAELFSERLKKGTTCITDDDVNAVIASIGRPQDFDAQDAEMGGSTASSSSYSSQGSSSTGGYQKSAPNYAYTTMQGRHSLYRNEDDKIIGGVCSGLANYLNIDPVLARIVFVIFFGALFWVYILLWIIVPSKSVQANITKRLYRSADNKVLGGVAAGLAAYFNVEVWIPRLIFALPLIIGTVSIPFGMWHDGWDLWLGPKIFTGSVGGTLLVLYVILWIAVPVASTAAEKLEMRGEKVDLHSIRDTVKGDMENFKSKAQNWWANEAKPAAQQFGEKAKEFGKAADTGARQFASEAAPVARRASSGIGNVLGVFIKVIGLIIAGGVVLGLLVAMGALFSAGVMVMPFKDYILEGSFQTFLAWSTLLFFFGIPLLAFLVWIIRKIVGSKRNPVISYSFGVLWIIGLISLIALIGGIQRNFTGGARIESDVKIQPIKDKMTVTVSDSRVLYYGGWWRIGGEGMRVTEDSLILSNVRLKVIKSPDSEYHVNYVRYSNANTNRKAEELASRTSYNIVQDGDLLYLNRGFSIPRGEKFRNQHVLVNIQVPVGKRILIDRSVSRRLNRWFWIGADYSWREEEWGDGEDGSYVNGDWNRDVEYIMTPGGIKRIDDLDPDELKNGRYRERDRNRDYNDNEDNSGSATDTIKPGKKEEPRFRYKQDTTNQRKKINDSVKPAPSSTAYSKDSDDSNEEEYSHEKSSSPMQVSTYVLGRLFHQ